MHDASFALLIQDSSMTQFTQNAQAAETSSQCAGIRLAELLDQSRQAADRLAVERGEDDGMIMHQDVTANASTLTTDSDLFKFLKGMSPDVDPARSAVGAR